MTCEKCELIEDKGETIYEDREIAIVLPKDASAKGHLRVYCKKHEETLDALSHEEVQYLFQSASTAATVIFDELQAHGTNIILNEGLLFNEHIHIDVIARMDKDGLDFNWDPQEIPNEEMEEVLAGIKNRTDLIGKEVSSDEEKKDYTSDRSEGTKIEASGDNILVDTFRKLP